MQFLMQISIVWLSMFAAGLIMVLAHFAVKNFRRRRFEERILPLDEAVAILRRFVGTWPTQKLHDVYAFCEDGHMHFMDACSCILGAYSSRILHTGSVFRQDHDMPCFEGQHYEQTRALPGMIRVEFAYRSLGAKQDSQKVRDSRFLQILKAEMLSRGVRMEYEAAVQRIDRTAKNEIHA